MAVLRKSFEEPFGQTRQSQLEIVEPYPSIKQRGSKSNPEYFGKETELPFAQETLLTEEERLRKEQIAKTRAYLDDLFGAGSTEYVPPKKPELTREGEEDPWRESRDVGRIDAARGQYEELKAREQEIIELRRARQGRGEW
jgi:hypothetical protein